MSVKISGMDKLLKNLDSKYGPRTIQALTDKAIKAGTDVFVKELQSQVSTFSDGTGYSEGYTLKEITVHGPHSVNGVRTMTVKWKGPKNRYNIIHLNEFGTVTNPSPRGKGAIARALEVSRKTYRKVLRDTIQRGL